MLQMSHSVVCVFVCVCVKHTDERLNRSRCHAFEGRNGVSIGRARGDKTMMRPSVELLRTLLEICERTDRQIDRHTDFAPLPGEKLILISIGEET